ncbi:MAG: hypothetical protein K5872_06515 [Rhizobiaceae bacterium]|nr:hypothetical protein [Rhizobiaceae bacterium]MCV0405867.1 hypothetical protein [Rhizobiaceae bacterium]
MPKGRRNTAIAIGLILASALAIGWFTFPVLPTLESFESGEPRNRDYRPGGRNCHPSVLALTPNAQVRLHQTENCEEKAEIYRQNTSDLIQQTRSANAAEAQADIASQQLWFGWFQTLGGLLTLAAAAAAAIYAREAARWTRESVNHTKTLVEFQSGAKIVIRSIRIQVARSKGNADFHWSITITIANEGSEVARNFAFDWILRDKIAGFGDVGFSPWEGPNTERTKPPIPESILPRRGESTIWFRSNRTFESEDLRRIFNQEVGNPHLILSFSYDGAFARVDIVPHHYVVRGSVSEGGPREGDQRPEVLQLDLWLDKVSP